VLANAIYSIIHFALFVIGCYETNVRNRMPRTVYVMQPIYGPPGVLPAAYQQLGSQGHPMPHQLPMQPPAAVSTETKTGPERFA
jgi:hypothetical protein